MSPSSQIPPKHSPQNSDDEPWPGPPTKERFVVVFHFYSLKHKHRLRLVVPVDETNAELDSLTSLWAGDSSGFRTAAMRIEELPQEDMAVIEDCRRVLCPRNWLVSLPESSRQVLRRTVDSLPERARRITDVIE